MWQTTPCINSRKKVQNQTPNHVTGKQDQQVSASRAFPTEVKDQRDGAVVLIGKALFNSRWTVFYSFTSQWMELT